ncbi:cation diffusion facilitator family transporter [Solwaraspora sp. WMMA2080]|uniref:cation diffusion facilitator family transporter n=1 Tax=unclassified Solwaraspora TaxID=2627926 RepID=UPI00248B7D9A|nr:MULTISPECIES: cation diffusion facilitator family transporter [unclassified Solwaraspora]WBB95304.1 cation diffusion facilitator family transporter [Solwaraspora sp. WMMA2059]WBC20791.1 cation diffusion facilitator family transporter [Solwaraspora sp. WMMA2080]
MGVGHDHCAGSTGQRHYGCLWAAFALLAVFMVVEAVTALATGSLALLSDAGHMFTDVLGIGMALAAIAATRRPTGEPQRTFGLYRLEVLAALANAVLLAGVALYVLVEAARRFADPEPVTVGPMLVVAIAGLLANIVAFALLRQGARESLNVRGAYLEVLGDLLGSVGVLVAATVIATTGWWYADPLVAVGVGAFILPRTWRLARAALRILVQAAPEHVEVDRVRSRLAAVPGVCDVHDLHVWTLTPGMEVASAHLAVTPSAEIGTVLRDARAALHDEFGIEHATLQIEPLAPADSCGPADW